MPAPCAGIFLHANYSPFDGRYRADGGPIHATCTPIRKAPAQPNATPPASDGARPNRFTTRGPLSRPNGSCRVVACADIVKRVERGELKPDPRHITELRLN